jgi:predicted  nucleic acid-binding Zn-ribbon protein
LNAELSQLISLQETDLAIRRLNEEIAALPSRQEQVERQFAEANREFLELQASYGASKAKRREQESALEAEQQKHQKFKDDLMKARNEREYTTALREIDVTKKTVSSLETEILKLMEQGETLEKQVQERSPEIEARRATVDRDLAEIAASAEAAKQQLAALQREREQLFNTLGPQAKATYQRLSRMRNGIVLAEARDYSCQSCRMKIRPQVFNDIKRAESIITCESCGRILYFRVESATT